MSRPDRVEAAVQVVILLAIGGMAAAASFTHVHDLTVAHGQPDWIGWANSVVLELMSVAAGLEIRRRKRVRRPVGFVVAVLVCAAGLSLAAQVAGAEPSVWGWVVAALPALGFLALVKIVLSRTDATHTPTAPATSQPVVPDPAAVPADTQASGTHPDASAVPEHLLTGARMAAFTHRQTTGAPITVDALAEHLSIPPALAGSVLEALGEPGATADTPASPLSQVNGTPTTGSRP